MNQHLRLERYPADKVPVCAEVRSGNTDGKTWDFDFIEKLAAT
ncbi:MAG: hypothetical protein AB1767_07865 [Bacillota bacterium]